MDERSGRVEIIDAVNSVAREWDVREALKAVNEDRLGLVSEIVKLRILVRDLIIICFGQA